MVILNNIRKNKIKPEKAKNLQEEFNKYIKIKDWKKKCRKQNKKRSQILKCFLIEEMMLLNLWKTIVQRFLKPKEKKLKEKDLNY